MEAPRDREAMPAVAPVFTTCIEHFDLWPGNPSTDSVAAFAGGEAAAMTTTRVGQFAATLSVAVFDKK